MEQLAKVACYFRWMRNGAPSPPSPVFTTISSNSSSSSMRNHDATDSNDEYRDVARETSRRLCGILESILLWENSVNSISVIIIFNILFWGIVILEVRGFAAASSAALVVVLCYSTLEAQIPKENKTPIGAVSHMKAEQIEKIGSKIQSTLHNLRQLRREQPGVFCVAVCSFSLGLWILGRTVNGILIAYTTCMSILLGPVLLLKVPDKIISHKEWDSEIEEFLPAVTETNLQVLRRAGESGDSPTPTSMMSDAQSEFFNDEDLIGLRMPSHEDGSTDGVELSELEFSENDVDGIKFQTGHFEKSSSSEGEAELEPDTKKIIGNSEESDCDFEIIDSQEIANLNIS